MTKSPDGHDRRAAGAGSGSRTGSAARAGSGSRTSVFELDPERNPSRWEALVERIGERARPILEARRRETVAGTLMGWRRPVLTAAATLAAAAVAVLLLLPGDDADLVEATFAEAMVPWSVAAWMDGSYAPTVEELVQAVEEYAP